MKQKGVEIVGLNELIDQFKQFGIDGRKALGKTLDSMGQKSRTDAIKSIQREPKTGKVYEHVFRTINGKVTPYKLRSEQQNLSPEHRASAPGEAPATDTGRLVSSIKFTRQPNATYGFLFSRLNYAFWLEYGTVNMAERPFLRPAVRKNAAWFTEQMQKRLDQLAGKFE